MVEAEEISQIFPLRRNNVRKTYDHESRRMLSIYVMSANDMNGALAGGQYCADSLVIVERLLTMLYIKSTDESRFGSTVYRVVR
jgi:hypothetical protein